MRLYADTSWWLAYKCRRDLHHAAAITLFDQSRGAEVVWTPWQRIEVLHLVPKVSEALWERRLRA
jgi:predicted nucleic acid-binding protein